MRSSSGAKRDVLPVEGMLNDPKIQRGGAGTFQLEGVHQHGAVKEEKTTCFVINVIVCCLQ